MKYNVKKLSKSITTTARSRLLLPQNAEMLIQTNIVDILRANKILVFSVPNGSHFANALTRVMMRLSGLLSGVSDIIIITYGKVTFVETKTETGKQSNAQIIFQKLVESLGFDYFVWRSSQNAVNWIEKQKGVKS